ncbi:type 4a pilus biogenesis protein PilO [Pseudomaricurvus alkylphenolicus]|uniref:type 4a pilus biogenesis protein PilO n=1 Tax=Pseudomaricurvus alkylphenolicus TaxID=1306991 RepID=UPI00142165DE|nr:type 4a pilus biogenesis protein PilO [Pseudomaricurvus alkylphenolicus]NIB39345.1 type 4a pilus biogenesis protein PilO [Pseudomaricurvus alkylphenolicus]
MALQDVIDQLNDFDINDIDWTRMGVWPVAAKVVTCALVVIALAAGTYFMFIKELNMQLKREQAQEEQLRTSFKAKAFQAANLEAYREQMKEMEKSFGVLVAQLPSDTEVPGLLEDIDEKGADSGLTINSIDLRAEQTAEFYIELPISVRVTGPYHDFGTFVSGVAGMPRIVTLHDYKITKSTQRSGMLDMTILAKTYRYKSKDE